MSIRHFACLVPDQEAVRKLAKLSLLGYGGDDLASAAKVARLLVRMGSGEDEDLRGEQDGRRERDHIQRLRRDERGLRETVLAAERHETPGKSNLERRLESLEKNEFRAEKLYEVINYCEDDAVELRPVRDHKGSLTSMKAASSVPLPSD